jgi:hypothetical protein
MKATLANVNATAPASPLFLLCCFSDYLNDLCICKSLLLLSGHNLYALTMRNLYQTRRTLVPVTRSTPGVLAANHTDRQSRTSER